MYKNASIHKRELLAYYVVATITAFTMDELPVATITAFTMDELLACYVVAVIIVLKYNSKYYIYLSSEKNFQILHIIILW